MKIDAEPLIPYLDAVKRAKAELSSSDADFAALSKAQKIAQVDDFLAKDAVSQKAYEEAVKKIIVALDQAVREAQMSD